MLRDAIIESPARGSHYQGNSGHQNYLIFQYNNEFFLKKTFDRFLRLKFIFNGHFVKIWLYLRVGVSSFPV